MTNPTRRDPASRAGPVGRTVRAVAATALATAVSLNMTTFVVNGPVRYRDPDVVTDPLIWLGTAILVAAFVDFAGRFVPVIPGHRLPRKGTVMLALGTVATAAAVGGVMDHGSAWGFPLADLVWWFNNAMMAQIALSFAAAAVVGTPGCEQGVWQDLRNRGRDGGSHIYSCVIGLHRLDEWEWRRRDRSAPDGSRIDRQSAP